MPIARVLLWVSSLAGIALMVRSLVFEPPPLWLAGLALLAYVTFTTLGVLIPRWEMYGDVFFRGDPSTGAVALSFDDGPHPQTTRQILEILERDGSTATFFVVGRKVEQYPDVVREIAAAGHGLGLHGWDHDRLYCFKPPKAVEADVRRTQEMIEAVCKQRPVLLRPPVGYVSHRTALGARRAGVELVAWSARGLDGMGRTSPRRVVRRVLRRLKAGDIIMLHDAAERENFEPAAIAALPAILKGIRERGLRVLSVEQLMQQSVD